MIDKLLGKIVFEDSQPLSLRDKKQEERKELQYLDLFTSNSPSRLAKGIGTHLGHFSRNFYPLPCYLSAIDDWYRSYELIISTEKKFKKFTPYPSDEFEKYLIHKVIMCKIVKDEVFSKNDQILRAVNHIKITAEGFPLVAKAKKYLGLERNPYQLSSSEFENIYSQVKELKEGVN